MTSDKKHHKVKDANYKNYKLATSEGFGVFCRVLWRWRGSVYRLLYVDLMVYMALYYTVRLIYIYGLNEQSTVYFEEIVKFCAMYTEKFPLSFVLGFFVSTVMSRWWHQYTIIPRMHGTDVLVSSLVHGKDDVGTEMRRTIVRYVCLSIAMALRRISTRARKRFPSENDLIDAGLLKEDELAIILETQHKFPGTSTYTLPIEWAMSVTEKARVMNRIKLDLSFKTLIDEIKRVQVEIETLLKYNHMNISFVYCQVVTIACYSYFIAALFGSQIIFISSRKPMIPFANFPIFLILIFIFYMGWLKVGEALMNPFGDDDDDIDTVSLIERNLDTSYFVVGKLHKQHPEPLSENYWEHVANHKKSTEAKHETKMNGNESGLNSVKVENTTKL